MELEHVLTQQLMRDVDRGLPDIRWDFKVAGTQAQRQSRVRWFGVVVECMKQRHEGLHLERLRAVTVVRDDNINAAIAALEAAVGHELPAARNGADGIPIFLVDLGTVDVFFARDDPVFPDSLGNNEPTTHSMWLIASTLAQVDFYAHMKMKFAADDWLARLPPFFLQHFTLARDVLGSYWSGVLGYIGPMATTRPFEALIDSLGQDLDVLDAAPLAHAREPDIALLAARMHEATLFLFKGIAVAAGYLDAAGKSPLEAVPVLWQRVVQLGMVEEWRNISDACRKLRADRETWASGRELMSIADLALVFLKSRGLVFEMIDGTANPFFVPPRGATSH